jgi:ribosomal protein L20A (L18A)
MSDRISNAESEAELKTKAFEYILREIGGKYKSKRDQLLVRKKYILSFRGLALSILR